MAAIHAAGPGRRTLLFERTRDGGRKILISGGGRCNVLPGALDERRYVTDSSPNSMRKILRSWPLAEQRKFFEETLDLPLELEPETGKLFPLANKSRVVRDALVEATRRRGVEWIGETEITTCTRDASRWTLATSAGRVYHADALVLATGGLSVPSTGSDGFGLRTAASLGHTMHATYPALTPLTLDPPAFADLAGVSLDASITAIAANESRSASGGFLFTHRGYSGPSVLDVSHVAVRSSRADAVRAQLRVQWCELDDAAWEARLTPSAQLVATALREQLPSRLVDRLLQDAAIDPTTQRSQLSRTARRRLIESLVAFPLPWTGDEGYKKAEVTGGGVDLGEVDPLTLESRRAPRLFLAGELLDAFGPIGGYNFVWAWVTGRAAGFGAQQVVGRGSRVVG